MPPQSRMPVETGGSDHCGHYESGQSFASKQNTVLYILFITLNIYIYICVEKCVCDFSRFLQACPKSRTLQYHYHYIIASSHRSSAQRQADPHPPLGQRHRGIIIITIAGGLVHSNPWIQQFRCQNARELGLRLKTLIRPYKSFITSDFQALTSGCNFQGSQGLHDSFAKNTHRMYPMYFINQIMPSTSRCQKNCF